MIGIKDLLLKFNNILLSEGIKKKIIINIIFEITNLKIKSENIKIKNNIIYLNIKPIYKNEMLLKKELILSKLKENLGEKFPKDIR